MRVELSTRYEKLRHYGQNHGASMPQTGTKDLTITIGLVLGRRLCCVIQTPHCEFDLFVKPFKIALLVCMCCIDATE